MNSTKKGLRIAGGVITIVISGLITIGALMLLAVLPILEEALLALSVSSTDAQAAIAIMQVTSVLLLVAGIASIVFASLLCANKKGKVMAIILIVLMAGLAVMEFLGANTYDTDGNQIIDTGAIVYGILCVVDVGLLAGYLAIKENAPQQIQG